VRRRQAAFGRNALDLQPPKSAAVILLHQLQSPVVALLAAAAALSSAFGDSAHHAGNHKGDPKSRGLELVE
jgi:hypothetical protein